LDKQLDQELVKKDEQLERKKEQLLQHLEQQEKQLKTPVLAPTPGQVQENQLLQPLNGEDLLPAGKQQKKEVQ
jgi:hypothetical protein